MAVSDLQATGPIPGEAAVGASYSIDRELLGTGKPSPLAGDRPSRLVHTSNGLDAPPGGATNFGLSRRFKP